MSKPIEDYALIGNMRTAALVARDGSIDWLCLPRFDSPACCAALLGSPANGHWQIAPAAINPSIHRTYRGDTMALETVFGTDTGEVALIDCLALPQPGREAIDLVRIIEGRKGTVALRMQARFRFNYGRITPTTTRCDGLVQIVAGPDLLQLRSAVDMQMDEDGLNASFTVRSGERVAFVLSRQDSWCDPLDAREPEQALREVEDYWAAWAARYAPDHPWREAVIRSLLTLKALSDSRTGGIVGAASMGLPEVVGGSKNYDYRYSWLRDATFTLRALLKSGYKEEARQWRAWMLRATAGDPCDLQPVYCVDAAWSLPQYPIDWLHGYRDSRPVLVGNQAWQQTQMDLYGEVISAMHLAHNEGLQINQDVWKEQLRMLEYLEQHWQKPGCGIWELGDQQAQYTHSQVMAWVAADRAVKCIENFGLDGDANRWRALAAKIHAHVCNKGFDARRNTFVQRVGAPALDAAVLRIPMVGFLPADDPRMLGTIDAIGKHLCRDGFVWRYTNDDEQIPDESSFLVCAFWLVENLVRCGRRDQARTLFERLLSIRNDLGLLSEQYDPQVGQLRGNFPQAFSHVGLINAAHCLGSD